MLSEYFFELSQQFCTTFYFREAQYSFFSLPCPYSFEAETKERESVTFFCIQGSARDRHAVGNSEIAVIGMDRPTLERDVKKIANVVMFLIGLSLTAHRKR